MLSERGKGQGVRGKKQEARGKRQEVRDKRQETRDKRQEVRSKKQEARNRLPTFIFLLLISCFLLLIFIVNDLASKEKKKEEEKKYREVFIEATRLTYNNKTKELVAYNVVLKSKDVKIVADKVFYNTDKEEARIVGSPSFTQPGTKITSNEMYAYFKKKQIEISGNVIIYQEKKEIKRETTLKEHLKEEITMKCDKISYLYEEKKGYAEGNIVVIQEDSKAYGKKAFYSEKEDKIEVADEVKVVNESGEWLKCDRVIISLSRDFIELQGKIRGMFKVEEEKLPETE